ncbi:MAG: methyltransferase domain-containing protein [Gemmatimonadales bacterium]|nr:methyltransferase domain-containing protein [Gemmatimonadales bacterium]NIN13057.1 methyltransferase domain-containing protein [Gemmatimonadales bacterium]NIN51141.1 methyltransferase domain-containing protein [Gemmatimonadales bacterium]NIP08605.1 methyltransferase domain-containing protein [Gemmatimonadales bacterium]NIR02293.1 methyltransferase domain-containing protein [Gemmatimonadales bacterium]
MTSPAQVPDPYEDFAERYDLFFGEFGKHDPVQAAFFRVLLAEAGARRILDCACGTGSDVDLLHGMGHEVWGCDISKAMLCQARRNLGGQGVTVPLVRADFRCLPYRGGQFDAVLCLTTSLPHLLNERDVVTALCSMRVVLREEGILVLSQGLTDKLMKQRPRFIPEVNRPAFSRVMVLDYFDTTVRISVLDLFHEADREEFKVDSFEYLVLMPGDYERLLTEAGYSRIECYGSYSSEPYDKEHSDQLIVVAHK